MTTLQHVKTIIAIAVLLGSGGAMAANISKTDYSAGKDRIGAEYKVDKAACAKLTANAKDICKKEAQGKEAVARAELEYSYTGKPADAQKVPVAKADAAFAIAKEKCDDAAGNAKDVCRAEAKATHTKALADAKLSQTVGNAAKDASADKRDADYQVAKEKCDALAGAAKDACIGQAKARFHIS